MSSRQQTREGREGLRESLLKSCRSGALRPGDALPPLRDLAKQHGLSLTTTQRVLQALAADGVLQLRQGAGVFVGHLPEHGECMFAAVFNDDPTSASRIHLRAVREGFEAEITRRGAATLTLTPDARGLQNVLRGIGEGELKVSGSFFFSSRNERNDAQGMAIVRALPGPRVAYADDTPAPDKMLCDTIRFDDRDGARQAVRHLWQRGHRAVAFVALHGKSTPATNYAWSRRREAGFVAAMRELKAAPRVFHPTGGPIHNDCDQQEYGKEAARQLIPLLREGVVSAVICANHFVLAGLIEAARDLPETRWPALIAFDDLAHDDHLLSVLRLPWDELGAVAAGTLWDRAFGSDEQKSAPPREIQVPMRLVARLSCVGNHRSIRTTMAAAAVSAIAA
jgi:DNA-binding LacI/PurR family transcriptional regulator